MVNLYGRLVSTKIKDTVKEEVEKLDSRPILAVVQVGNISASTTYVKNKENACKYTSITPMTINLEVTDDCEDELLNLIQSLNNNKLVNGILVQLPLPSFVDEKKIINAIHPDKDVDCFHPINVGKLYTGCSTFKPCTPSGIIEILKHYNINLNGKKCVVIGRSNIVGKPMAQLLLDENCTTTICHSKTKPEDLKQYTLNADIIVSAVGKLNVLTSDMVKDDAIIIDVGMNRNSNNKLCGDVDYTNIINDKPNVMITPVPGGVGPMTIAMLMKNTLMAYKLQNNLI